MDETRFLAVTRQEAELLMDSFRVANPLTRGLALKAASVVLEFAVSHSDSDLPDHGHIPLGVMPVDADHMGW